MSLLTVSVNLIHVLSLEAYGRVVDVEASLGLVSHYVRVLVDHSEVWLSDVAHEMLSSLVFGISLICRDIVYGCSHSL